MSEKTQVACENKDKCPFTKDCSFSLPHGLSAQLGGEGESCAGFFCHLAAIDAKCIPIIKDWES
jgi:hypothetical protein